MPSCCSSSAMIWWVTSICSRVAASRSRSIATLVVSVRYAAPPARSSDWSPAPAGSRAVRRSAPNTSKVYGHIHVGLIEVGDEARKSWRDGCAADLGALLIQAQPAPAARTRPAAARTLSRAARSAACCASKCPDSCSRACSDQRIELPGTEQRPPLARQIVRHILKCCASPPVTAVLTVCGGNASAV